MSHKRTRDPQFFPQECYGLYIFWHNKRRPRMRSPFLLEPKVIWVPEWQSLESWLGADEQPKEQTAEVPLHPKMRCTR
jgi:hypothetical protein